jgi:hypothetical protein
MAGYALRLSDSEMIRYQRMAQQAREAEAELWERAGLSAGATSSTSVAGPVQPWR